MRNPKSVVPAALSARKARAFNRGIDLGSRSDDAGVIHQRLDLRLVESRDPIGFEILKGTTKSFAAVENGPPRQTRLETLKHQHRPEAPRVVDRHAPFLVVVGLHQRVAARPCAPLTAAHRCGDASAFARRSGQSLMTLSTNTRRTPFIRNRLASSHVAVRSAQRHNRWRKETRPDQRVGGLTRSERALMPASFQNGR